MTTECRTPRILDEKIQLNAYDGELRKFAIRDLGHEAPTIMITNYPRKSPAKIIQRYARRMLIENNIIIFPNLVPRWENLTLAERRQAHAIVNR